MKNKITVKQGINWLRYSGISVIITVNPFHWIWVPQTRLNDKTSWPGVRLLSIGWLFLTVRLCIDNGDW